jgi:hypothetical protein
MDLISYGVLASRREKMPAAAIHHAASGKGFVRKLVAMLVG